MDANHHMHRQKRSLFLSLTTESANLSMRNLKDVPAPFLSLGVSQEVALVSTRS